jgi:hypothetical protein
MIESLRVIAKKFQIISTFRRDTAHLAIIRRSQFSACANINPPITSARPTGIVPVQNPGGFQK